MGKSILLFAFIYLITLAIAITFIVLYATKNTTNSNKNDTPIATNSDDRQTPTDPIVLPNPVQNPFEKIDKIYYINLDHRTDRKYQIESELRLMNVPSHKVQRIPGIIESIGALGCSKAHLLALQDCLQNNYQNCLILEDDFMFKLGRYEVYQQLNKFWTLNPTWDVVLLASNTKQFEPTYVNFLVRLTEAQTASGYLVNATFLPQLIENVTQGIQLLEADQTNTNACIDQHWKSLQPKSHWYTFTPVMAHQRPGYSDIEKTQVNYTDQNELTMPKPPVSYIISVLSCAPRLKKSIKQIAALETIRQNHNIQYFFYYGDPDLSDIYEVNLEETTVCVKARDDYLNLSHKIGQMMHFLQNYIAINHYTATLKGVLFIDDDLEMYPEKLYNFLEARYTIPYWGNMIRHNMDYSDHLKQKNEQSSLIQQTLLQYPELLQYPIKIPNGVAYCSGGCFYLSTPTLTTLLNLTYAFQPFPQNATELEFHKRTDDTGKIYFDNLCIFNDSDIGSALNDVGITPTKEPIREIVYWEGLE
jgi:GR25 family glycosyltransferase involved in LPS biosynthesis